MKYHKLILALLLSFLTVVPVLGAAQQTPLSVGGIKLGSDINDYTNLVESKFLKDLVITDWHGFRKGTISYGVCKYPNKILKIDMKYEDKSKKFYQELLQRFRDRFGEPDGWHGDSFGVVHLWKWSFRDTEGNRVSLSLQYNAQKSDETIGNMTKLSYPELIAEERRCFMEICKNKMQEIDAAQLEEQKKSDWSYLIPR